MALRAIFVLNYKREMSLTAVHDLNKERLTQPTTLFTSDPIPYFLKNVFTLSINKTL